MGLGPETHMNYGALTRIWIFPWVLSGLVSRSRFRELGVHGLSCQNLISLIVDNVSTLCVSVPRGTSILLLTRIHNFSCMISFFGSSSRIWYLGVFGLSCQNLKFLMVDDVIRLWVLVSICYINSSSSSRQNLEFFFIEQWLRLKSIRPSPTYFKVLFRWWFEYANCIIPRMLEDSAMFTRFWSFVWFGLLIGLLDSSHMLGIRPLTPEFGRFLCLIICVC